MWGEIESDDVEEGIIVQHNANHLWEPDELGDQTGTFNTKLAYDRLGRTMNYHVSNEAVKYNNDSENGYMVKIFDKKIRGQYNENGYYDYTYLTKSDFQYLWSGKHNYRFQVHPVAHPLNVPSIDEINSVRRVKNFNKLLIANNLSPFDLPPDPLTRENRSIKEKGEPRPTAKRKRN